MQEKYNVTGMTSENLLVYKTGVVSRYLVCG